MTTIGVKPKKYQSKLGKKRTKQRIIKKKREEKSPEKLFEDAVTSIFEDRDDITKKVFKFKINKIPYFNYDNLDELYEMYFLLKERPEEFDKYFNDKLEEIKKAKELGIKMKAPILIFDSPLLEDYKDIDVDVTELMRDRENVPDTNWTCKNKKCGSKKIILKNLNNRSGDEGMTVTYTCYVCGENWSQAG